MSEFWRESLEEFLGPLLNVHPENARRWLYETDQEREMIGLRLEEFASRFENVARRMVKEPDRLALQIEAALQELTATRDTVALEDDPCKAELSRLLSLVKEIRQKCFIESLGVHEGVGRCLAPVRKALGCLSPALPAGGSEAKSISKDAFFEAAGLVPGVGWLASLSSLTDKAQSELDSESKLVACVARVKHALAVSWLVQFMRRGGLRELELLVVQRERQLAGVIEVVERGEELLAAISSKR